MPIYHKIAHQITRSLTYVSLGTLIFTFPTCFAAEKTLSYFSEAATNNSELDSLRQQLLETTRELHKYKAQLFRSSHPEDQTKIAELSLLMTQQKATNEQLAGALQSLEKELILARKQTWTFEISNDALSTLIKQQRLANDMLKGEHAEKLTNFTKSIDQLQQQLVHLQTAYEAHTHASTSMGTDLEDALHESGMLKFTLAELRSQNETLQQMLNQLIATVSDEQIHRQLLEIYAVLSLNDLTMALDHFRNLNVENAKNLSDLEKSRHEIHSLREWNEKSAIENRDLMAANTSLNTDYVTAKNDLSLYYTQVLDNLKNTLQEKEEALAATNQCHLADNSKILSDLEKSRQEIHALKERNERSAIENRDLLAANTSLTTDYVTAKNDLSLYYTDVLENLKNTLQEKEEALTASILYSQAELQALEIRQAIHLVASLHNSESMIEGLYSQWQTAQKNLSEEERQHTLLQTALDTTQANYQEEKQRANKFQNEMEEISHELTLLKEQRGSYNSEFQMRLEEKEKQIAQSLTRLEELEFQNEQLQRALNESANQNLLSEQHQTTLTQYLELLTAMQTDLQSKEQDLEEKIKEFSILAENQANSLAEANRLLQQSQDYTSMLEKENSQLKDMANSKSSPRENDTAERTKWSLPGVFPFVNHLK